jgi:hypothetical protein
MIPTKYLPSDWTKLSLRIIALFATAMLVSYSPDYLRDFFGDETIPQDKYSYNHGFMDGKWNWGYRHYLYFWMCVALFFTQAARLFTWVGHKNRNFEP